MKISEAILKGCEMVPVQRFRDFGEWGVEERRVLSACVMGTAAVGKYGMADSYPGFLRDCNRIVAEVRWVMGKRGKDAMFLMNDGLGHSRERIAELLALDGF